VRAIWWRIFYATTTGRIAIAFALLLLRAYGLLRGGAAVEGLLGAIERRYVFSGWPYYGRGWVNLHMSRLTSRLRHEYRGVTPSPPRRSPPPQATRIACVGGFVGLLGFTKELMASCPVELVIADTVFNDLHAGYLADDAAAYGVFDLSRTGEIDRMAAFVNTSRPDMVVNIGHKYHAFELIDRLDAPCLANFCAGSDLLHHPRIDFQYHGQPEADYFVRDHRMFCGTTASCFGPTHVQTMTGYIDPRRLLDRQRRSWLDREPLIVLHGSLYKFASEPFMSTLWHWLRGDRRVTLVLMGRDDEHALETIRASARTAGVDGQLDYRGQFSAVRDQNGEVSDPCWFELVELLGRARLAPNAFPLGGGSSRFEAYALGVPAPHLGVRLDRGAWGRSQPSICDIPAMLVPDGTAWSVDEYRALGERCLSDAAFADALTIQQLERARVFADADRWWRDLLAGYEQWRSAGR
jgi:hypothetical protein